MRAARPISLETVDTLTGSGMRFRPADRRLLELQRVPTPMLVMNDEPVTRLDITTVMDEDDGELKCLMLPVSNSEAPPHEAALCSVYDVDGGFEASNGVCTLSLSGEVPTWRALRDVGLEEGEWRLWDTSGRTEALSRTFLTLGAETGSPGEAVFKKTMAAIAAGKLLQLEERPTGLLADNHAELDINIAIDKNRQDTGVVSVGHVIDVEEVVHENERHGDAVSHDVAELVKRCSGWRFRLEFHGKGGLESFLVSRNPETRTKNAASWTSFESTPLAKDSGGTREELIDAVRSVALEVVDESQYNDENVMSMTHIGVGRDGGVEMDTSIIELRDDEVETCWRVDLNTGRRTVERRHGMLVPQEPDRVR